MRKFLEDNGVLFSGDEKVIRYVNSDFIEYQKGCYIAVDHISNIFLDNKKFVSKEPINDLWSTQYDIAPEYIDNFKRLVGKD